MKSCLNYPSASSQEVKREVDSKPTSSYIARGFHEIRTEATDAHRRTKEQVIAPHKSKDACRGTMAHPLAEG
jgi:hypothetical protein